MNGNNSTVAAHPSPSTQNGHKDGPVEGKAIVVVGAQWGDEGKGKLVDLLVASKKGMNVCRCQVSSISPLITSQMPYVILFSATKGWKQRRPYGCCG